MNNLIQLRPQAHQPAPESFADYLRRLVDQFEAGHVVAVSVIATDNAGRVSSHHSDDAPALTSRNRYPSDTSAIPRTIVRTNERYVYKAQLTQS